jgi:adenine-specific DNA-methyltransferase
MPSLQFKGKSFVQNYHLAVPFHELIPVKEKSLTDKLSLSDNLIIHGDNLKALKALLPLYANKVKCIYIDPPYNTGNEKWTYNDNVNSPMMQEWLGKTVDNEDLTRHDKWLCMMTPRLKLLRELLSEDGLIFVSIDDNEIHHLRILMDETFGENNFMAQIDVLVNPKGRVMSEGFSQTHEYLLAYRKTPILKDVSVDKSLDEIEAQYTEKDKLGPFRFLELRNTHRQFGKHNRPNLFFKIYCNPKTGDVSLEPRSGFQAVFPKWEDGFEGCWTWGPEKVEREIKKLRCRLIGDVIRVYRKAYAFDQDGEIATKKPTTTWNQKEFFTEKGQSQVDEIFGERIFYSPKPVSLIEHIIQISTDENSIVLDSFSGSGTTAHATLALNKKDDGNRKFILIETEDYADKVTAERARRVIMGVKKSEDEALKRGLGGSFTFCELGEPMDEQRLLAGKSLPTYDELARYVFYVSTGEEFKPSALNKSTGFIGESAKYHVYMFYEPKVDVLRNLALDLDKAEKMKPLKDGKRRLVFAPTKYLDQEYLDKYQIDFSQLPYEIYQRAK